jgi:[protein]-arginine 3-hydroxylase / protease
MRNTIERVTMLPKHAFLSDYFSVGRPVILTRMLTDWPARDRWTPEHFKQSYGHVEVVIETLDAARASDPDYYLSSMKRRMMTIERFLCLPQEGADGGKFYLAQTPITKIDARLRDDIRDLPFYRPLLRRIFRQQELLWMGPKGCVSALHFDALPNFNVQFFGRKRWVIFPKEQQENLYVPSRQSLPHFSPIDYENPDLERFPKFREATPIEFVLEPGEVLFLPRGWVHYVSTIDFSISMNLWWLTWQDAARRVPKRLAYKLRSALRRANKAQQGRSATTN